jgi:hypothetical protein
MYELLNSRAFWVGVIEFWAVCAVVVTAIGGYRIEKNKVALPADMVTAFSWIIGAPIWLFIFLFRYIKYKIRGKNL